MIIAAAGAYVAFGLVTRPDSRTPARFWLAVALLLVGTSALLTQVSTLLTDITGIPNLVILLNHLLKGVAAACAAQCMLRHWVLPPEQAVRAAHRLQIVYGAFALAMVILFAASAGQTEHDTREWQDRYGTIPAIAAYIAIFNAALGWMLFDLGRLSWRYASRIQGRPHIRLSLQLFAAAGWAGLVYCVTNIVNTITAAAGAPLPDAVYRPIVTISQYSCILLIAAAAVIPGIGGTISRSRRAITAARMFPLSAAMSEGTPSDGQVPKALAGVIRRSLGAKDDQLLNNMVVQIRDTYLQLRPYLDSRVSSLAMKHATAAGLSGEDLAATVEAATLAVALRTKRSGEPPVDSTAQVDPGAPDLAGEARWLGRVSRAYARSPIVQQVLEETRSTSWVDEQMAALGINHEGDQR